jgi:superfamily II DNA or RNA helicase
MELRDEDWFSKGVALARECNEHIVDASIQCMLELRSAGTIKHQIIAAACSIDHAKSIRSLYTERGFRADVLHSDMEPAEQERVRSELRAGILDSVVHVQMLGEGADYPTLGVAAVFRPYRHMVPYVQFVGRVMRVAKEGAPGDPDNRAYVVSHVGLNVDRWWDELKQFDADDQLVFSELANSERAFTHEEPRTVGVPRRRFRPAMEVLQDVVERFVEVGFLEEDAAALADDVIQALALRGVSFESLGLSRAEMVKRILAQRRRRDETSEKPVEKSGVQPQRRRQEARRRLDERVRSAAKELLNELNLATTGRQLLPMLRRQRPANNLAAAIILLNLQVQKYLSTTAAERDLLSVEELLSAYENMDTIIDAVAESARKQLPGINNGEV